MLLGGGGRESALARAFFGSELLYRLYIAPGNAGTAEYGENIELDITDVSEVAVACRRYGVDLLVVGPEAPLVAGVGDEVRRQCPNTAVFGPGEAGAVLEGSKVYAKRFMAANGIPTADYISVDSGSIDAGLEYIRRSPMPIVIKADGLCGGKGSVVATSREEAESVLRLMLSGQFGAASRSVVIEQYLQGRECSVFVLTDGKDYAMLPVARDYKRAYNGDSGPNTGGMGAISPVGYVTDAFMRKVEDRVVKPTLHGLQTAGIDYRGVLYLGLMAVQDDPYLLEYNVRMGDPETSVVLARTRGDVLSAFFSVANGLAGMIDLSEGEDAAVAVVMAAEGYPGTILKDVKVEIDATDNEEAYLLAGGICKDAAGNMAVSAGRAVTAVGIGTDVEQARQKAYQVLEKVSFLGAWYRSDIAF